MKLRVGLVGDHDPGVVAHRAIPKALELAAGVAGLDVAAEWIGTETIDPAHPELEELHALWCVPASPYRSTQGALTAIRFARQGRVPFLGTCGGVQHAVLEVAASLWGIAGPANAELDPQADDAVIVPLGCALVEESRTVHFAPLSRLGRAYGVASSMEEYHCSYGIAARCGPHLEAGPLRATAWDEDGDVRGVELDGDAFFVGTLFQPERAALRGVTPPIVLAFLEAAVGCARNGGGAHRAV